MQANKRNLSEILSQDIRLVAPLFQRPYVWSEDQNWVPLWNALIEVVDRRLNHEVPRPYFLGALVLDQVPNPVGTVQCRELIDGQQRMTTLQVVLEVARREFESSGLDHQAKLLEKLTRNLLEEESDEQFKVWPTNLDREAFRSVMLGRPADGLLASASTFFADRVQDFLDSNTEGARDRATAFVAAVKSDLVFVAIDLDNDDDGQLIFETLNSLGTPLLPSDLVKNLLFREAIAKDLDTESLYLEYWRPFEVESAYWREEITVGRRLRPRLDSFLQYYLTLKLNKEPLLAHQFRDFRDAFRDGALGGVREALEDFATHAQLWREFDQAKAGAPGSLRHVLWVLDATVPNPLILGIYRNAPSKEERDAMLETLESYLIRRFLCCLLTKAYNRIVADLIALLKRNGWSNDVLRSALLSLEGNSSVWPDDGFVNWRVNERDSYGNIRGGGIAYVLARVEATLRTDYAERNWNPRTPLTIEHIMPRRWEEHWPLADPGDDAARNRRNELIHRMGNLTVLTKGLNSSISNSAWEVKRKHLKDHTVLSMNSALAEMPKWDEESIEARTRDLAQRFCEIWPR